MRKYAIVSCFALFLTIICKPVCFAQKVDSVLSITDTIATSKHSPRKATILSMVVPGAGQIYNHKWWKVPIIYGGGAALFYSFTFSQNFYRSFVDAYKYRTDMDSTTVDQYPLISTENLLVAKDYYRRNRDLSIIGLGLLYVANVVDAYVDAQLFDFDVSDNLSLHWQPQMQVMNTGQMYAGIGFNLNIKQSRK